MSNNKIYVQTAEGRLDTFKRGHPFKARSTTLPPARILSRLGFCWTGSVTPTTTQCFTCEETFDWGSLPVHGRIVGGGPKAGELAMATHVALKHAQLKPDCPFAQLMKLSTDLHTVSGEPAPLLVSIDSETEWKVKTFQVPSSASSSPSSWTLVSWPHENATSISADCMANAGFIYTPNAESQDLVTCLDCGVELDGWESSDNPLLEHQKRSATTCRYLLALKDTDSTLSMTQGNKAEEKSNAMEVDEQPSAAVESTIAPILKGAITTEVAQSLRDYLYAQMNVKLEAAKTLMDQLMAEMLNDYPSVA